MLVCYGAVIVSKLEYTFFVMGLLLCPNWSTHCYGAVVMSKLEYTLLVMELLLCPNWSTHSLLWGCCVQTGVHILCYGAVVSKLEYTFFVMGLLCPNWSTHSLLWGCCCVQTGVHILCYGASTRKKSPLGRIKPTTLHQAGQPTQHTTNEL